MNPTKEEVEARLAEASRLSPPQPADGLLATVSIDALITWTKLRGSACEIKGHTTPEGHPFLVLVMVDKGDSPLMMATMKDFISRLATMAPDSIREDRRDWP